jgi:Pentapeptide repeats (8 copies)
MHGLTALSSRACRSPGRTSRAPRLPTRSAGARRSTGARLQGALLFRAQLQGASLSWADLQGAWLSWADLQGASLTDAELRGAWLEFAQLQGASLDRAQLQGASLVYAQLQGASLDFAQLQGASLSWADLQGALLEGAQLRGALLTNAAAWRADARKAVWQDTFVVGTKTGPEQWSVESFGKLKQLIAEKVPEDDLRSRAMDRIMSRLDPSKPLEGEDEMAKVWEEKARSFPTMKRLAEIWRETGCASQGAPYVLRGLLVRLEFESFPFGAGSPQPRKLAAAFLDEEHCPGAHGLTDAEKAKLKAIRDRSPPPSSKQ